jgi:hypothetical protein
MTAAEHLAWAKARAIEYLDCGELPNAIASMASDVGKHAGLDTVNNRELMAIGVLAAMKGPEAVEKWIDEFST